MRSSALVSLVILLAACEPKSAPKASDVEPATAAAVSLDTPMKRDLDRICNAEEQSGALHEIPSARSTHVGVWLATNLESQEARTLSAELSGLAPPERIARLKKVLSENGLADCEIIATW